jgi:hypothetical protein
MCQLYPNILVTAGHLEALSRAARARAADEATIETPSTFPVIRRRATAVVGDSDD